MKRTGLLLWTVLILETSAPVWGDSAQSAFRAGQKAEKANNPDIAYQAYKRAHDAKPNDPKFMAAFIRLRFYAAAQHIKNGDALRDESRFEDALAEYRIAEQIDPTNFEALGEIRRTTDAIQKASREKENAGKQNEQTAALEQQARKAAGPAQLVVKPNIPVSIHMTANVDAIYKTIGKFGGVNVLVDPEYKPPKITFDLTDVKVSDALDMLSVQSKTFWRPLSSNTILITADNSAKRKEFQQSVMKTFYLRNAATPADLQEAAGTLKGILDISHIQVTPELRSLTLRCTPDQLILAQKLLGDIDKPKAEVLVEVIVMEVTRDKLRTLGTTLPTTVSAAISPSGSGSSGSLTLNSIRNLTANDISVSVSGGSFTALATDANTKVIQRPQIRILDSQKASLRIGDRIPIATGTFQSGLTQGVNTQFQYIDVGVNVDITPYIHSNNDVTLQLSLEVSSVTGEVSVDGVTEPQIGQRRIDHEARLADGEVNLIGGILDDTESKSLSGYPGILNFPILKYLFGQETKQRNQSEIVFAIIPHVIRSTEVTEENEKIVDLGSEGNVTFHSTEASKEPVASSSEQTNPQPAEKPAPASH
jgi:general secretion pathway protein D